MKHDTNSFPALVTSLHDCDRGRNCFYENVTGWPDTFRLPVDAPEGLGVWSFERVPADTYRQCQSCTVGTDDGECIAPCMRDAEWYVTGPHNPGRRTAYCVRDLYDMVPWPQIAPGNDDGRFWRAHRG